ncbi:DUF397 domain-containing protein [Kitasatospora sp. NBC_01302]|uniref:DUF397 domain-containing protein n=1 Tax=Kitasatospora sp. NBC_01302 TaxID=2903575 RepID=UPI002E10994A|nr:DUF397 domain-containing protein [Kitasatospora sp. NBC_01302]
MKKQNLYDITPPVEERFKSPLSEANGSCVDFAATGRDASGVATGVFVGDSMNPGLLGLRFTPEEFTAMADGIAAIRKQLGL